MQMARVVLFLLGLSFAVSAQSADTGTAHKAAATALLNSNNSGAARLACPATISAAPTATPPQAEVEAEVLPGLHGMRKADRFLTTSIC